MRTLVYCIATFLVSGPEAAQPAHVGGNSFQFPSPSPPPAPTVLAWQLSTQDGQFVEATIPVHPSTGSIDYLITRDNAAMFDINFDAWAAAAADIRYNRSAVTFMGMTKEQPLGDFLSPIPRDRSEFELDRIQFAVTSFYPGWSINVDVQSLIVDLLEVPEPATPMLLAFGCCAALTRLRILRTSARNISADQACAVGDSARDRFSAVQVRNIGLRSLITPFSF
jgi:hypothetical protein